MPPLGSGNAWVVLHNSINRSSSIRRKDGDLFGPAMLQLTSRKERKE